ncbi:MAG: MFS transporter [Rickettsiales bacterium]
MPFNPRSAFKPLIYPAFRSLWIATLISTIGTWMQSVSAAWVMTGLTTSTIMVALLQSASSLPTVFFSIPGGAIADIVDRRKLMIGIQLFMAIMGMLMTGCYFAGLLTPWLLLFFTFSIGIGTALYSPAWFATTPALVPPEDLSEAITLNGIAVNASRAIGPAIAGVIISIYSPGLAFALNTVSFLALALALLRWKYIQPKGTLPGERFIGGMKAGLRYVRQSPHMHKIFLHAAGFFLSASALWALMPLVARHELHLTATGYGVLLTSMGLGAVFGAFFLPMVRSSISRNMMVLVASLGYASSLLVLGNVPSIVFANLAMLIAGISWISAVSSLHVTAQTSTASWVRARALAVYLTILFGGMGFGSIIWGNIAEWTGVPNALLIAGITLLLVSLSLYRIPLPKIDNSDFEPSPHWGEVTLGYGTEYDEKPVMVQVEYIVSEEDETAFLAAIQNLESLRRRDGAIFWGVYHGVEEKHTFTEYFLVESWLEHLRQHERVTKGDKRQYDKVRAFHKGEKAPRVTHWLARA